MAGNRELSWRRWLSIALRTLHLVGVVLAGIAFLGNGDHAVAGVVLMLFPGFALFAIDVWQRPGLWREVAGAFIFVKLLAMMKAPASRNIYSGCFSSPRPWCRTRRTASGTGESSADAAIR